MIKPKSRLPLVIMLTKAQSEPKQEIGNFHPPVALVRKRAAQLASAVMGITYVKRGSEGAMVVDFYR